MLADFWASKERAEWSPSRQAAYEAAKQELAQAKRQAEIASGHMACAAQVLSTAKGTSIRVALVTVQRREDAPNFNERYDLPFDVEESTDHTGHVYSYDRSVYREVKRKENTGWEALLPQIRQRIKDAEQALAEAEEAYDNAVRVHNRALRKLQSFE